MNKPKIIPVGISDDLRTRITNDNVRIAFELINNLYSENTNIKARIDLAEAEITSLKSIVEEQNV